MASDLPQPPSAPACNGASFEPSDRSLLRHLRQGSQDAATKLYYRYAGRLRALAKAKCSPRLLRRVDPDDIVQSVFHRFFRHASRGDYDVPAGDELWSLFLVIALNRIRKAEAFHHALKRDVRLTSGEDDRGQLQNAQDRSDDADAMLQMTVNEAMEQLPAKHQQVLQMRIEGYEVAEIAERCGRSQRTVERILQETEPSWGPCFMTTTKSSPPESSDDLDLDDQFCQLRKLEAVGRLAGGVAHDFNNVLTVILGCCQLLLDKHREQDDSRELLEEIQKAGERAALLTRQLLMFSRKQEIQRVPLNLNHLVTNMVQMLRRLINENIHLRTSLDDTLANVKADPGQIEQVLLNLVVNARDAMPMGGKLSIETRSIALDRLTNEGDVGIPRGSYATLTVRDSGRGMDKEVMAHLFEPFFTTKEMGKGTGLGLATVYGIVKQNEGHIRVASKPGQGARFRLFFPAVAEAVPADEQPPSSRHDLSPGLTILVVEDDEAVRALAKLALQAKGCTVLEAKHGLEALALSDKHPGVIDLVVTDVIMPFMSGPQLVGELMQRRPSLKVLFMSGYTDNLLGTYHESDLRGGLLQKPFTPSTFLDAIRRQFTWQARGAEDSQEALKPMSAKRPETGGVAP